MYVGTGSTRGWQGWIKTGRHRHSMGEKDWQERQEANGWAAGVVLDDTNDQSPPDSGGASPLSSSSPRASLTSDVGKAGTIEQVDRIDFGFT